jgi:hypothetical protein
VWLLLLHGQASVHAELEAESGYVRRFHGSPLGLAQLILLTTRDETRVKLYLVEERLEGRRKRERERGGREISSTVQAKYQLSFNHTIPTQLDWSVGKAYF